MCTLITSKSTDIDENIANQNHATRTRTPKPGYLNLSNIFLLALGMEIMKYMPLENIFNLSYYGVNNNTT